METHNLGNYLIVEPMMQNRRREFPDAEIRTTIQLSDKLCSAFNVEPDRHVRWWKYKPRHVALSFSDLLRALIWRGLKLLGIKSSIQPLISSELLAQFSQADLILNFDGDYFGDNANPMRFLENCLRITIARILGKPIIEFSASPGPFTRSVIHRWFGPSTLNRMQAILNREPASSDVLRHAGVKSSLITDTACPSFLFSSKPTTDPSSLLLAEGLNPAKPIIGVILCGWNMPKPPYTKAPRDPEELLAFLPMLNRLLAETDAQLLLMSHSHRTGKDGSLEPGPDFTIMSQFYEALKPEQHPHRLFLLKGLFDATDMRGILSQLDLLVSGRLHGAVSAMTNCVPTVIVDYGHEPKAHKLRGLAQLMEISDYLVDPAQPDTLAEVVASAWRDRAALRTHLQKRLPEVQALARKNFALLHDYLPNHATD